MSDKVSDIANQIWVQLGEPSTESVASISWWLRTQIGQIDLLLNKSYTVDEIGGTYEFSTDLTDLEKVIFQKLYNIYYYNKLVHSNMGSSAFSAIQDLSSDGGVIRLATRSTVAQTYLQIVKAEQIELDKLINAYKLGAAIPLSVDGNDIIPGYYTSRGYYTRTNCA